MRMRGALLLLAIVATAAHADTSSRRMSNPLAASGDGAITLADGDVLAVSGRNGVRSSETYNAQANKWTPTGDLKESRYGFCVVRLLDGRALAIGGYDARYLESCEIYDPRSRTWKETGSLKVPRGVNGAELLPDGRVLLAGGCSNGAAFLASELYDPKTGTWSAVPGNTLSGVIAMASLPRGRVLVCGGSAGGGVSASAEIFDGATKSWKAAAPMRTARSHHSAVALKDGRVLVCGNLRPDPTVEIYDAEKNAWTKTADLETPLTYGHSVVRLTDGRVLLCGGALGKQALLYDSKTATWKRAADLSERRSYSLIAAMADGRAIVLGGSGTAGCTIYDPKKDTWERGPDPAVERRRW